jgi:hypothetical protein
MAYSNTFKLAVVVAAVAVICLWIWFYVRPEMSYACDPTKPDAYPACMAALKKTASKKCTMSGVGGLSAFTKCLVDVDVAAAKIAQNPPANLQVNWRCRKPGSDPTTDICIFNTTKDACTSPCSWCTQDPTTNSTGTKPVFPSPPTSNSFKSGNSFLTVDNKGDLVLHPVSDVDSSINLVSKNLTDAAQTTWQPKSEMGNYQTTANMCAWEQKADWITEADIKKGYELWNPYLADKSKTVYIQNADKGTNWFGAYGDRGGFYDNSTRAQSYNHWWLWN